VLVRFNAMNPMARTRPVEIPRKAPLRRAS
jgi:hypothetical protein